MIEQTNSAHLKTRLWDRRDVGQIRVKRRAISALFLLNHALHLQAAYCLLHRQTRTQHAPVLLCAGRRRTRRCTAVRQPGCWWPWLLWIYWCRTTEHDWARHWQRAQQAHTLTARKEGRKKTAASQTRHLSTLLRPRWPPSPVCHLPCAPACTCSPGCLRACSCR